MSSQILSTSIGANLPAPGAPTVTPTGGTGAVTYDYVVVAKGSLSNYSPASAAGVTTTGVAFGSLSGSIYNAISWSAVSGASSYDVYRTVGGTTTGKIGTTTTTSFHDTGLAGDGATAPSAAAGNVMYVDMYVSDLSNLIASIFASPVASSGITVKSYLGYGGIDPALTRPWNQPVPLVTSLDGTGTSVVKWQAVGTTLTPTAITNGSSTCDFTWSKKTGGSYLRLAITNTDTANAMPIIIQGEVQ